MEKMSDSSATVLSRRQNVWAPCASSIRRVQCVSTLLHPLWSAYRVVARGDGQLTSSMSPIDLVWWTLSTYILPVLNAVSIGLWLTLWRPHPVASRKSTVPSQQRSIAMHSSSQLTWVTYQNQISHNDENTHLVFFSNIPSRWWFSHHRNEGTEIDHTIYVRAN